MGVQIHHTAEVENGAQIGAGTKIWHQCHVRTGAKIGARCVLGKNVFVDSGAILGDDVHVQNNCSVYAGVVIGNKCFIGPHVTFTNDKYPRVVRLDDRGNRTGWDIVQTIVDHGASICAGAVIICGHTIGSYAMIGAGAVVCRDILPYELVIKYSEHVGMVDFNGRLKKPKRKSDRK